MYTLGLSFGFHDSAVALLHNDQLVYASHEERLSLSKHDDSFPALAIDKALAENGLELRDINRIAYYESPELKFTRILSSSLAEYPFGIKDFCSSMQSWLSHKIWLRAQLEKYFQIDADKIDCFEHHDSHAMQAFVGSGFSSAAILVIDAVGEWATSSIYQAKYKNQKFFLEKKWQQDFPHSLGLFYSAMTAYLGFQPMNDECSLMALAAFGKPRFYEQLKELVFNGDLETFQINKKFLNFNRYVRDPFTKKFTNTFGPVLSEPHEIKLSCVEKLDFSKIDAETKRIIDMAASVQKIFEVALHSLISRASALTGETKLCYAGGAALNCVANSKLVKSGVFEKVYIPNEPGDGGAAIGAAYLSLKKSSRQVSYENCAIGTGKGKGSYTEEDIALLSTIDPTKTIPYIRLNNVCRPYKVKYLTLKDELELVSKVAKLIAQRKAIGWFQGVYEFGPRALGQRSILFRPDDFELMERVSKKIKSRASFRPYALSMTEAKASQLLDLALLSNDSETLRRMQLAVPVKESFAEQVRCGLHIDGSTRPQVITQNDNSRFYNLLNLLSEKYNIPALINTSFNESSFPIVAEVEHAFLMFYRTDLDVLVIDNHIIEKEES